MELKDEIRNARLGKGMTQKELGEKVYRSPAEISHYEKGRRVPSDYDLELLEKALGTKLGEKLASSLAEPGEETGKSRFRRLEDMKSPEAISRVAKELAGSLYSGYQLYQHVLYLLFVLFFTEIMVSPDYENKKDLSVDDLGYIMVSSLPVGKIKEYVERKRENMQNSQVEWLEKNHQRMEISMKEYYDLDSLLQEGSEKTPNFWWEEFFLLLGMGMHAADDLQVILGEQENSFHTELKVVLSSLAWP